jgi:23S rRNA pseudouridine2605 synthase
VVTELGSRVNIKKDEVVFNGKTLEINKLVYFLLNKPANYITTTDDDKDRQTVMDLMRGATRERIYPVGRLDRQTTGLLLLTNDGDLAEKLMHPSNGVVKTYHVVLDKPVGAADMMKLTTGIVLADGLAIADEVAYIDGALKNEIGIRIHIGKNRIVRRMFEYLGYTVEKLDRVGIAFLTKKGLQRGKWRELTNKEIGFLKMGRYAPEEQSNFEQSEGELADAVRKNG